MDMTPSLGELSNEVELIRAYLEEKPKPSAGFTGFLLCRQEALAQILSGLTGRVYLPNSARCFLDSVHEQGMNADKMSETELRQTLKSMADLAKAMMLRHNIPGRVE